MSFKSYLILVLAFCNGHMLVNGCACFRNWDPVCAVGGTTYANRCTAGCYDAKVAFEGECSDDRQGAGHRPAQLPAHGASRLLAKRLEAAQLPVIDDDLRPAQLPADVGCPHPCQTIYLPVCGSDGKTYDNACQASCVGVVRTVPGECRSPRDSDN